MANDITTDGTSWNVNGTITSSSGFKKTLNTSGKFVDRDINVNVGVKKIDSNPMALSLIKNNWDGAASNTSSGITIGARWYFLNSGWMDANYSGTTIDGFWGLTEVTIEEGKNLNVNEWTWSMTDGINYISKDDLVVNIDELEILDEEAF